MLEIDPYSHVDELEIRTCVCLCLTNIHMYIWMQSGYAHMDVCERQSLFERWGAGVETQKNVRGEIGGWGRVPFNEPYAPSLSTIYDGA